MAKCNSCGSDVPKGDAFCGTCGEPMPGETPVVPLSRSAQGSAPLQTEGETKSGGSNRPGPSGQATAAMLETDSHPITDIRVTASRPIAAAAEVLPLRRRKTPLPPEDSEGPDDPPEADPPEADPPEAEAVPLPTEGITEPPASDEPESIKPVAKVIDSDRPNPVLASELLRQQNAPAEPGQATLRRLTVALCVVAAPLVLWLGGIDSLSMGALALLIAATTLALTPMPYAGRAIALFLTGLCAVSLALWQQTLHGLAPDAILLACSTILLGGSLLFRAYYRAARMARVAVTFGVLALLAWFFGSEGHRSLVLLQDHWSSWGPALTHALFGLLAVLSLLAYMEGTTRGGTHWWAYSLLALYAAHLALLMARRIGDAGLGASPLPGPAAATIVLGAAGVTIAAVALAQVFVSAYRAVNREKE